MKILDLKFEPEIEILNLKQPRKVNVRSKIKSEKPFPTLKYMHFEQPNKFDFFLFCGIQLFSV